jgi:hypothetical protein
MDISKDTATSIEPSEAVQEQLSEIMGFYSLLLPDSDQLHEKLSDLLGRAENDSYEEGYDQGTDEFEAFEKDPFHEDLELCERIGNKQAHRLFKDCVTLEDFKEVMREVEIQNCIAMPILGL